MPDKNKDQGVAGGAAALTAYSIWGIYPLYFKIFSHIPAFEVLAHRILWTVVLLGLFILFSRRSRHFWAILANKKILGTLLVSSLLVSLNWLIFIWAISHSMVLEASLGYFINPLVSIALGMIFLKEKLRFWQWFAVAMSVFGVTNLIVQLGTVPWVALSLAFLFGFYGLIRKVAVVDAFSGLFVETILILPPILIYLIYIGFRGGGAFGSSDLTFDILLVFLGAVTAIPLLLFTFSARKLSLSTLGFFQYITPSAQFMLAVFLYNENFSFAHQITFGMIWTALAIYTLDTTISRRKTKIN
jgi:chloramphenicol-sensitive protein RarD